MKEIMSFLRQLQMNNNTEWFHAHRAEYEHAKAKFNVIAERIIAGVASFDPSVGNLELKDCTYRINRDIRFSLDKSPYKTHFGVFVCPGGKKSGKAGYYFHISPNEGTYPDGCMLAIGHYCYDKNVVQIVREDIEDEGEKFDAMIQTAAKYGFELDHSDDLKKVPRGFSADSPYADYLKLKAYCLWCPLSEELVYADDMVERVLELFKVNKPFNDYLNRVIEYSREED